MSDDPEFQGLSAVKLQSILRRSLARKRILSIIFSRTEKIWDPRRKEFYYYDTVTDRSSWRKPRLLRHLEITEIAPTYQSDEAAEMIVRQCLRRAALRRVRMLYQVNVIATYDEGFDATYYYNSLTESTTWELPLFMNGKLDYAYDKLPLGGTKAGEDNESSSESEDSDLSIASEVVRERRRVKRKFPRSKLQVRLDTYEDNLKPEMTGIQRLDLHGLHISHRLSDRIWDMTKLQVLNLSHNLIPKLSPKVQYLIKLADLDVSHNMLTSLPRKMEDLTQLKTFNASHNSFSSFTGFFFKCSRLESVDFSFNLFQKLPIVSGNLELLKATKQWDVGIGVLKGLRFLNLEGNKLTEWPEQLDRNLKLQNLNMKQNFLTHIPSVIDKNAALLELDLSNNLIVSLPTEIYYLPLKKLLLNNNCLEDLPELVLPKKTDGGITNHGKNGLSNIKMSGIVELNISYNKISALDFRVGLFEKVKFFYANDNCISDIHENIGLLKKCKDLNLSRNKITGDSVVGIGGCEGVAKLNLSCNMIEFIPDSFSTLRSLVELNVADNLINFLPEKIFLSFGLLQTLDFHNNEIGMLPMSMYAMRKLSYLDLSFNCITHPVPKQVEQFVLLNTLLLSNNCITEIPESISALTLLTTLEVDTNKLTRFPMSISKLKRLQRVTTRGNNIEIKPYGLTELPNLLSWDMGWNTFVGNNINWEEREAKYNKDVDVMSAAFFFQILKRAKKMLGQSDESKHSARIHDDDDDAFTVMDTASVGEDDLSAESGDSPGGKKKKLSKKKQKEFDEKKRLADEQRIKKLESNKENFKYLMVWHKRMKTHFENHVKMFASSVYLRQPPLYPGDAGTSIQTLENKTHLVMKTRTNIQMISMFRDMFLTSQLFRSPLPFLEEIPDHAPVLDIIENLDLGYRYQSSIELYEYISCEVISRAEMLRTERKKLAEKLLKDKRRAMFMTKGKSAYSSNSRRGSFLSQRSGLSKDTEVGSFEGSLFTARSNAGNNTARANLQKENSADGVALLDLALGSEPITGRISSARDMDEEKSGNFIGDGLDGLDPEGNDLNDPSIHDIAVVHNEVTLEEECDGKILLVDFDAPPPIVYGPLLFDTSSDLHKIAFESYYGLGLAILYRVDKMSRAIRNVEIRGGLLLSRLDVAQRFDDDFRDLVTDIYDETLELMKKKEESASGSFLERKKKKMAAFMNASGADNVSVDAPEEPEPKEKEVPGDTKKKKKKKKKVVVAAVVDNSEAERKVRMEKAAATGKAKYAGEPIKSHEAAECANFLFEHRRLLSIWANKAFDSAAELLKLRGWDTTYLPPGPDADAEMEEFVEQGAENLRSQAMDLHFHRARALQSAQLYDRCLLEYQSLISLCRGKFHRTAELEVIKVTLAKSDFPAAQPLLHAYIERDVPHADIKFPEPFELLKDHHALALLLMYSYCGTEQLVYMGYKRTVDTISFNISEDGILEKPKPVKECDVWKVRNIPKDELYLSRKRQDVMDEARSYEQSLATDELKAQLIDAKTKFKTQVERVRSEMEEISRQTAQTNKEHGM